MRDTAKNSVAHGAFLIKKTLRMPIYQMLVTYHCFAPFRY